MTYSEFILLSYGRHGAVLDTNIFLLHVVGWHNPDLLQEIRRTAQFDRGDWTLLNNLLSLVPMITVTPHILTESCNLLDKENRNREFVLFQSFRSLLLKIREHFVASADLASSEVFLRYGLADASMAELGQRGQVIITDDAPLENALNGLRLPVINFNHVRSMDWIK